MPALTTQQRKTLETAVKDARKLAEAGARHALETLAVHNPDPYPHMTPELRSLRVRLRSKGRLLEDALSNGHQQIDKLAYELAYEYWHKMLFAKFLESNGLLMHPEGVTVSMDECEELAAAENFTDKWDTASAYASKMLPAIFRPDDPLMQVSFASNDRIKLEEIIDALGNDIFTADDALGWVYQFWQSEAKAAINASGAKIDGARLPAVTQLFTEPYMVHFLIDNTIGAWWVSRHPSETPPLQFEYLRYLPSPDVEEIGLPAVQVKAKPAAGTFEGWPNTTKEITSLDPCMGSGHFVASLFTVFAKLRMYEEDLSKEEATNLVITQNLQGLEIDPRCTQIAAFNLALTAWKFCGRYMPLPQMNLACSGVAPKGRREDWVKLIGKVTDPVLKARMENGMKVLYDHFQLAPELGSLLDPTTIKADILTASFDELQPTLLKALDGEADKELIERGVMAAGIAKAGQLLAKKYTLIITNVPYLKGGNQETILAAFCDENFPAAKKDLATVFLEKLGANLISGGYISLVMPQNWLFQTTYKSFREKQLRTNTLRLIAVLGAGAFVEISGEIVKPILINAEKHPPTSILSFSSIDISSSTSTTAKLLALLTTSISRINQLNQLNNPDARITFFEHVEADKMLSEYSFSSSGQSSFDRPRFYINAWELPYIIKGWKRSQTTSNKQGVIYDGFSELIFWQDGKGDLAAFMNELKKNGYTSGIWRAGEQIWGRKGIAVSLMGDLNIKIYLGDAFDQNTGVIVPKDENYLTSICAFTLSQEYSKSVRKIDRALKVTSATITKVPFDLSHWQKVAAEKYPNGLPKPYSDDATQWLFHGHPIKADHPLQVAVARLLGYRWPAEVDTAMELADEARDLIDQVKAFEHLTDDDGIMCIPAVNGELPLAQRLRSFLQAVYGAAWGNNTIEQLLTKEAAKETNLEDWLRISFFEQHVKQFQNRPFIWHIWDGRKDGFSALVNYHRLSKQNLQRLIYTYLGDWIHQCEAKKRNSESGAEGLLSAALALKTKLEAILHGEATYDIFIRWKPLEQQPIGWEPDLNDGVRLNIRPFITADVLRKKLNIKWGIDRGKNPPGSHWGEVRDNDKHLSLEEKRVERESTKKIN